MLEDRDEPSVTTRVVLCKHATVVLYSPAQFGAGIHSEDTDGSPMFGCNSGVSRGI